jgi:hypothetical protein
MRADGRTHGRNVILVGNSKIIVVFLNFVKSAIPEKPIGVLNQEIRILRTGMYYVKWCITKKNRNRNKLIFITNNYIKTFTKKEKKNHAY